MLNLNEADIGTRILRFREHQRTTRSEFETGSDLDNEGIYEIISPNPPALRVAIVRGSFLKAVAYALLQETFYANRDLDVGGCGEIREIGAVPQERLLDGVNLSHLDMHLVRHHATPEIYRFGPGEHSLSEKMAD